MAEHTDIEGYLASLPEPLRDTASELRSVIDGALAGGEGRIWHGHPVWMSGKAPLAGFKAYTAHVTFMIWHGDPITDPTGRLQVGARMATVKLASPADIDRTAFARWLGAAHAA